MGKGHKKIIQKQSTLKKLATDKSIIKVDLGCGENKQDGCIGIDFRKVKGVDIVQNLTIYPWKNIPDEFANIAMSSHLLEHINPDSPDPRLAGLLDLLQAKKVLTAKEVADSIGEYRFLGGFVRFMDEVWRILKPGGQFISVFPYAGSPGYWQDPTHCLEQNSEILSRDGFKRIVDVKVGEEVLTKNLETKKTEWSKVVNVIDQEYTGPMVRFKHQRMNISVTPNHDMIYGTWVSDNQYKGRADEFTKSGRIGFASLDSWDGGAPEQIIINDTGSQENDPYTFVATDFMALLGWIVSEGSFLEQGNQKYVSIFQGSVVNVENYQEIVDLVKRMGLKYYAYERRIDIISANLYAELYEMGKQDRRYIPIKYKNLSRSLLNELLDAALRGDGEEMANSDGHIYTSISKRLADDIQEIATKCGFRTALRKRDGSQFISPNGKTYRRKDQYRVSVADNNPVGYPEPITEQYNGRIECVTVEKNNTIFVRQNGYTLWVGNCNPITHVTLAYFDPLAKDDNGNLYHLYSIYRAKPWQIVKCFYDTNGFLEVCMEKRLIDRSYGTLDDGLNDKTLK